MACSRGGCQRNRGDSPATVVSANTILGLAGSLLTLTLLFEMLRRKKLRGKYASFWAVVALLTLVVALAPRTLFWLSDLLGVQVPANLLFFVASMTLMAISIHHSHELGRLEERTRILAEELAVLRMRVEERGRSSPAALPVRRPGAPGPETPDA